MILLRWPPGHGVPGEAGEGNSWTASIFRFGGGMDFCALPFLCAFEGIRVRTGPPPWNCLLRNGIVGQRKNSSVSCFLAHLGERIATDFSAQGKFRVVSVGQWNRDRMTHRNHATGNAHTFGCSSVCRIVLPLPPLVCRVNHSAARHTCPASEGSEENREKTGVGSCGWRNQPVWVRHGSRETQTNSSFAHAGLDGPPFAQESPAAPTW